MGQLGKEMLRMLDKGDRRQFLRCLNAIADKRDVVSAARCLIEAKENYETKNKSRLENQEESKRRSKWTESYKGLLTIKKALDDRAKQPGARVYEFRMLDLVIGNETPTRSKVEKTMIPPIVHEAYSLIRAFEGKSKEVGSSSNIKFLSPRLAPIMPDKADIKGSLSPSILSFYKDDTEDQLLPIPKLLDATGMSEDDREDVLETVMEMAGARQVIDDALKTLASTELFGMQGELQEVTERVARIFTNLERNFNQKQKKDMKKRGFTFLEKNQLRQLHQEQASQERLKLCLKRITYTKDLRKTASCILKAREQRNRELKFSRPR
ncbi:hypothetical protein Y032_0042g672 [Ancylostoma ceylanicum]|uniref:Uncharacterized protein n=1 Tax=Ancylostoma ceylanicum TaxID=53326 RepID=A0A016UHI2_9BILA|nr:hypothetical protein Y032_0042g672 [Ancylostoma ceylanicum]